MPLKLITAPSVEPVVLAEARANLRITDTDSALDTLLTRRCTSAREWAEIFTQRAFITQTWELVLDAFPVYDVVLDRPPLQSVTSIKYIDADGVEQTLATSEYTVDIDSEPGRVYPAYAKIWPSTRCINNAVRIRFVAGYGAAGSAVPSPIREAIYIAIGHWTNYQASDEYGGATMTRVPRAAEALLWPYRDFRF